MELKVEKNRVLEAAQKFPCATDVLRQLFPNAFEEETFRIGDYFLLQSIRDPEDKAICILATMEEENKITLISLATGYKFCTPLSVKDWYNITRDELRGIVPKKHLKMYKIEGFHEPFEDVSWDMLAGRTLKYVQLI